MHLRAPRKFPNWGYTWGGVGFRRIIVFWVFIGVPYFRKLPFKLEPGGHVEDYVGDY